MSKKSKSSRQARAAAPTPARWRPPALWYLLAAAFAIKLVVLLQLQDHPLLRPRSGLDSGVYLDLARRVAGGDLLSGARVFFVSPLYIYFFAAMLALSSSILVVQIVQIGLGTLAIGLMASVARQWYGEAGGWVVAVLMTLTGYFTFNEMLTIQSALDPVLTAAGLWLLVRAWNSAIRPESGGVPWAFVSAGLILGLHILNRPNVAAWAVAAIVLTFFTQRVRGAAALAAGVLLAVAPVAIRNSAVSGELALVSSHGGLNFYIGNHAGASGTYQIVEGITPSVEGQDKDMRDVAARAIGHPVTDAQASSWFYTRAWSWIAGHPAEAARLFARKVSYVFNATDIALNDSYAFFSRDEPTLLQVLFVGPWLILPLGLAGLWLGRPMRSPSLLVWAFVPVYAVSVAAFFVAGRYRLPLLVVLCLPATGTMLALAHEWREKRYGRLAPPAAAIAALGLTVNLNLGLDDGRSGWRAERIVTAIEQHQDDRAEALLQSTEPTFPQRAMLLESVANAYLARGDAARGVTYLERALRIAPAQPTLHINLVRALVALQRRDDAIAAIRAIPSAETLDAGSDLAIGRLAQQLGDTAIAEPFLARAAAGLPNDAAAHQAHGMALAQLGRTADALAELEFVTRQLPGDAASHLNLAVAYAESHRFADARREAQRALDIQPDYARAKALLAALPR